MVNKEINKVIIASAMEDFFLKEKSLILSDASERCLCTRLAMCFEDSMKEQGLSGYYADTEYNRNQGQVKTIISGDMKVIPITCDLIIHSRGEIVAKDNLIAIEMAKVNKSSDDFNSDRNRLRALTKSSYDDIWSNDGETHPEHVCGYLNGLYLIIDSKNRKALLEHYVQGAMTKPKETIDF